MQPARGRFARFDLDRQMASTFPAHWKVGPAPVSCFVFVYFIFFICIMHSAFNLFFFLIICSHRCCFFFNIFFLKGL